MNLKLFVFTLLSLSVFTLKAQQPDAAMAMVHYKFSHIQDTTRRDSVYRENMVLLIGKNASVYRSQDRQVQDALMRQQVQDQLQKAIATGGPISLKSNNKKGTTTEFYQFGAEKKLIRKERMINNYLIEEELPVIKWKISADTANFSGLHCQKALAHFRGRDYVAWFCPDMPYHTGPWKLNGLPGLIIEAADVKSEVVFKFDGIEDAPKLALEKKTKSDIPQIPGVSMVKMMGAGDDIADPGLIALPATGIKATEKEIAKLKEIREKDPNAFAQSAMAASGMNFTGTINSAKVSGYGNSRKEPVLNNPIELPEKK